MLDSVLGLSPGLGPGSWVVGVSLGTCNPSTQNTPHEFFSVFFFLRLFDPLLRTRASRKEYSDELGSQNDSKMEVKSEPGHQTAAGANLSQTLPGMSGLHVDPFLLDVFFLLFWPCFCGVLFGYNFVDCAP